MKTTLLIIGAVLVGFSLMLYVASTLMGYIITKKKNEN